MSERNTLIDIAKGLGIILVVLGHNWMIAHEHGLLFRLVFSFHMPLFFFLSGIFLTESEGLIRFVRTRADGLLKPYFVVLAAWGVARICVAKIPALAYFVGVLYATGNTIEWVPLWFLPHLFLSLGLALTLLKMTSTSVHSKWIRYTLCGLCLWTGWWLMTWLAARDWTNIQFLYPLINDTQQIFPGLPWSIDVIGISAAFVLGGFMTKDLMIGFRLHWMAFGVTLLGFGLLQYIFGQSMDLHMRYYGNPVISTLQAVLGIYLALSIAAMLQKRGGITKMLTLLGQSSLFILLFHSWIEWKLFVILQNKLHQDYVAATLALFAGIFLPVLMWMVAQRSHWLSVFLLPYNTKKRPAAIEGAS